MDFDIKRFLLAMLLCSLVMILWMKFVYKPPVTTPDQSSSDQSANQTAQTSPSTDRFDPNATSSDPKLWMVQRQSDEQKHSILGDREPVRDGFLAQVTIDGDSASIAKVVLNKHKDKITDKEPGYPLLTTSMDDQDRPIGTFQLNTMKIEGRSDPIDLSRQCWHADTANSKEKASFTATIGQKIKNRPATVFQVTKTFQYHPDNHELELTLTVANPTRSSVNIKSLEMFGPTGIHREDPRGERRKVSAAFAGGDGEIKIEQESVSLKSEKEMHKTLDKANGSLQWMAVSNKFFAAIVRPMPRQGQSTVDYIDTQNIEARAVVYVDAKETKQVTPTVRFDLRPTQTMAPGTEMTYTFRLYLGPISKEVFEQQPYAGLHYNKLIYSSSCSWCAFDWLTNLLLWMMKGIYLLVHNYGIAIIVLVLLVRLILHPISKKSQVSMQKMGKIGPKIQELREKCGSDKQEFQRRQMELMKEHGMTGGMLLGCLPMLLQMPIWIALFTAVDSNVAVRHQGLFPAGWHWLTDLSAPDRLIPFSVFGLTEPIQIPLLGRMIGGIDAFNLLPILVTVAMYLQMKRSTSQSMAAANPQAQQQQKMMMYMMPVMMLLFFYNAPTGLNLYIMASTFGGLIEQHFIRKHLKEAEAKEQEKTVTTTSKVTGKFGPKKKKPKPPRRYF